MFMVSNTYTLSLFLVLISDVVNGWKNVCGGDKRNINLVLNLSWYHRSFANILMKLQQKLVYCYTNFYIDRCSKCETLQIEPREFINNYKIPVKTQNIISIIFTAKCFNSQDLSSGYLLSHLGIQSNCAHLGSQRAYMGVTILMLLSVRYT